MTTHTVTAMYSTRQEAEKAAAAIQQDTAIGATNVRVLPEHDAGTTTGTTHTASDESSFLGSLRAFFMPEEDRYGYAEGMRRGSYMVAVDTDDTHADHVMNVLEDHGAIDMDAEESRWRSEGWRGYEPSSTATAGSGTTTGGTHMPAASNTALSGADVLGTGSTGTAAHGTAGTTGSTFGAETTAPGGVAGTAGTAGLTGTTGTTGTSETIPLAEETLRVGKRQISTGRVRVRTYVVETPVNETVRLREEHVEVERRPVDRPATASEDLFREREVEATTSREEAVVSKDARIREELVLHKSAEERDETIRDTVRRTEVREDRGDEDAIDPNNPARNPSGSRPA
jgi:uncharacterized protein (TIGR02271 family)